MDSQSFTEFAKTLMRLKMYPYFDVANYILMCWAVREDNHPSAPGSQAFSRKHPFSCWVASMLMCFAGGIIGNLLVGEPIIGPFQDHQAVLTATVVWYLINFAPFDVVYKLTKLLPVRLMILCMKEIQRTNKIHHAILYGLKHLAGAHVQMVLYAVAKGAGYTYMRVFERQVRGLWIPSNNEFLQPGFVTKGSLAASVIFLLSYSGVITTPFYVVYFSVVVFFIYFRLMSAILAIHDPFLPFENLFCSVFMGGMFDALKRAVSREKPLEDGARVHSNGIKHREEKKND